ncbi:MAG: TIGR03663 family protein [Chloroflexi bacterium]|nr:TIGR03663 family protein [Chloroflexota bacterium]
MTTQKTGILKKTTAAAKETAIEMALVIADLRYYLLKWWRERKEEGFSPRTQDLLMILVLAGLAFGMRIWDVGSRALHHDESLHAYFSWVYYDGRGFFHNPLMHGPFQFEANAGLFLLFGASDVTARLLYVIFGTVLVFLPWFFRERLGRLGALAASVMLVFSPALLYYSRFARNDILMAVWVLGLVICLWRYMDEGKNRFLYIAAGLFAFAFASKESAYLVLVVLSGYLILVLLWAAWKRTSARLSVEGLSPPDAVGRFVSIFWNETLGSGLSFKGMSRAGIFLFVIVTLTLPQWAASLSILQEFSFWPDSIILAAGEGSNAGVPIGAPAGVGFNIAMGVTIGLLVVSVLIGVLWSWFCTPASSRDRNLNGAFRTSVHETSGFLATGKSVVLGVLSVTGHIAWRCRVWLMSAAVFYTIWILLYTTFFTNMEGLGSGMWQGLGYWIQQQDVARGNQPWYYYFLITPLYEFLPMFLSVVAAVYYLVKKDRFGIFLGFWAVVTFVLYMIASEKMPWLLVNITLPLIILGAKFLGDMLKRFSWNDIRSPDVIAVLTTVPLVLVLAWRLALSGTGGVEESALLLLVIGIVLIVLGVLSVYLMRRVGVSTFGALAVIPIVVILFVFTVRTGFRASYQNGDTPVEMLIYVQSTPDIPRLSEAILKEGKLEGVPNALPVAIDLDGAFQWPWSWYLRDSTSTVYPSFTNAPEDEPTAEVVLVHHNNDRNVAPILTHYQQGQRFRFRWWFPEDTYRNLTLRKFVTSFADREAWRTTMDYFLYRKDIYPRVGSEDGVLYLSSDFQSGFIVMPTPEPLK